MRNFLIEYGAHRMWHLFIVPRAEKAHYVATFGSIDAALDYINKEFL